MTIKNIQTDENGNHYLEFSEEELKSLGWNEGDTLKWTDNEDGSWIISKEELDLNPMRVEFEKMCKENFVDWKNRTRRDSDGLYTCPIIDCHWYTFQDAWEAAINHIKNETVE